MHTAKQNVQLFIDGCSHLNIPKDSLFTFEDLFLQRKKIVLGMLVQLKKLCDNNDIQEEQVIKETDEEETKEEIQQEETNIEEEEEKGKILVFIQVLLLPFIIFSVIILNLKKRFFS